VRINRANLASGEILLEGLRGNEAHAHLDNGRLFVHNCFGNVDLSLDVGNVAIVYEWWEEEQFTIRSRVRDGNSFAYIPSDAAFHLIAHTATGKIGNDFAQPENRHAEPISNIDIQVGDGGKATLEFETQDGNIKISEHNP
jgi:DUF4097 and DUF4098 domain-containing protein YvlB